MRWMILAVLAAGSVGCGTPSFLVTPVAHTYKLEEYRAGGGRGSDKIALIELEGMLINARTGGFMQPTENKLSLFAEQLAIARRDEHVKAVVLRVNSPGGTVTTSDAMYEMLVRFKRQTKKPVIASFQEVAASGAYYVACAADTIVANPTSVVGSIGVVFNTFEFEGTLAKVGARAEAIKSGPLKDMGSPFKALTPAERGVMQGMVDEYYARFVTVVQTNRPVAEPNLKGPATDGRVFSGLQAQAIGLVDEVGMLEDAIKLARKRAKAPGASVVMYKRPFGYRGSIYASAHDFEQPAPNVTQLQLPGANAWLPSGFYYMWRP